MKTLSVSFTKASSNDGLRYVPTTDLPASVLEQARLFDRESLKLRAMLLPLLGAQGLDQMLQHYGQAFGHLPMLDLLKQGQADV